jgi:hypothetical protein
MAKSNYLPTSDNDLNSWLINFNTKLPTHAATLGISAPQLLVVSIDTQIFTYYLNQVVVFTNEKEERVNFKNVFRDGPIGLPALTPPTLPVIPAPPPFPVIPGLTARIRALVQIIKNHPNYNVAIGQDLGVIGSEIVIDLPNLKPVLELVKLLAGVEVRWKKGVADALRIEKAVIVTAGPPPVWNLLAIDTEPHYLDTTPVTGTAIWQYRAGYIINDGLVGQWSDVSQVAVG